jgi:hypothetical protein
MAHKILCFFEDSSGRYIFISMSEYYVPSTAKSWKASIYVHRMNVGGFVTIKPSRTMKQEKKNFNTGKEWLLEGLSILYRAGTSDKCQPAISTSISISGSLQVNSIQLYQQ